MLPPLALESVDESVFASCVVPIPRSNQVAVVGCSHGELDNIYAAITNLSTAHGVDVDLLVCCGDFQVCYCCFIFSSFRV